MLTVKHTDDNGYETLVPVISISFDPENNCLVGVGMNATEIARWTSGHAYVMNDYGKTVGVYSLRSNSKKE